MVSRTEKPRECLETVWIPETISRANRICLWWWPAEFTPSALDSPKLCAATSVSTSQHNCISNSKFQQKTHNHIHPISVFGLLAIFSHFLTNLLCTHFASLCTICCLFNKEEEASGQRDIWQSEEKGRHWLNGVRQQLFPWYIQPASVLSLNGKKVPPKPCEFCSLHPVTSDLQKITVPANNMLCVYAI